MQKPVLAILAAGMGSRYGGGIKQMDPIDPEGCFIIDYSVYDALRAGFDEVVFIIKHAIEADFKATIGTRVAPHIKTAYAYQELDQIPAGIALPEGRVKPLGTTHALLSAEKAIAGGRLPSSIRMIITAGGLPFAVRVSIRPCACGRAPCGGLSP